MTTKMKRRTTKTAKPKETTKTSTTVPAKRTEDETPSGLPPKADDRGGTADPAWK
jgi:hypothetical protein